MAKKTTVPSEDGKMDYRVSGRMTVFKGEKGETGTREVIARFGDTVRLTPARAAQLGTDVVVTPEDWDAKVTGSLQKEVIDASAKAEA